MLNDIYYTCINQQQPECQIIWAIYSQKYIDKIKLIDFYNIINPIWKELESFEKLNNNENNNNNDYFFLIFFIFFIFLFFFILKFKKFKKYINIFYKFP